MNRVQKKIAQAAEWEGSTVEAMIGRYEKHDPEYGEMLRKVWEGKLKPKEIKNPGVVLYEDPNKESYRRYRYRCYGYLVLEALLGLILGILFGLALKL